MLLIAGGLTYEMAPKAWGINETTSVDWATNTARCYATGLTTANQDCQLNNLYPGTAGEQTASTAAASAVGMGSANNDAIIARMNAGSVASGDYAAGAARAYPGGGYTDWFLPSKDELNAMCNYSRNPSAPALPTVPCTGLQNGPFAAGTYGFANQIYWSSSEGSSGGAWGQYLFDATQLNIGKNLPQWVRPIRAF